MELTNQSWESVMNMPYDFFIRSLRWKSDLEQEKAKKLEEKTRGKERINNSPSNSRLRSGVNRHGRR